ncbi:MAG: tRNA-dihydrouridine synthase family protein [SAR324 cluster bacterium]|nr:tRNA-dihydrouridine synthase family protein [SAR324 cluster bacterium]
MAWSKFKKPYVCLAPMDGVTNTAYRQIVRKVNKHVILFSEFTNVDGLIRSDHVRQRLDFHPSEHPFFMQLFGNNPQSFAEASRIVEDRGVMGIDINMGCPAKKIVHSQHGSALMQDVDLACRLVEAVRAACSLQVSVKTRLGWENASQLIPFGKRLESAGVSLLTIHGRTYRQAFKGEADWEPIYELKKKLDIPVLGNGDVTDFRDGLRRLGNLDGFMIGRKAIGNPWVFQDGRKYPHPPLSSKISVALEHYYLLRQIKAEQVALREFRKYLGEYIRGFYQAKDQRRLLMEAPDEKEFIRLMEELKMMSQEFPLSQAS